MCNIYSAEWNRKDELIFFKISANRFLRGMVRSIVGTMLEIGQGKRTLKEFIELLESKDRKKAGAAAPAHGLCLAEVRYPEKYFNNN